MGGLWVLGKGNEAGEEQHLLGLQGLVEGYEKTSILSEFPTFHNTQKVLQCYGFLVRAG